MVQRQIVARQNVASITSAPKCHRAKMSLRQNVALPKCRQKMVLQHWTPVKIELIELTTPNLTRGNNYSLLSPNACGGLSGPEL
jgi:hypothetical protein